MDGFPYVPYEIQRGLMEHVYDSIDKGRVTVVESPTGTGKSLSLICSTLAWLKHSRANERARVEALAREQGANEPDWVTEHDVKAALARFDAHELELERRMKLARESERQRRRQRAKRDPAATESNKKRERTDEDDDEFAPPSELEGLNDNVSPVLAQIDQRHGPKQEIELEEPDQPKVVYTSRTHSQLSQVISEVRKTTHDPRVIALGSRQSLCINDDLRARHDSASALNDACLDLQKSGSKKCAYLAGGDMPAFRDVALSTVRDIEELAQLGRETKTCPYYGARKAVKSAQLVTLPYNLLQPDSRAALGLSLEGNIVVVDEAHNIVDSLLSNASVTLSARALDSLASALLVYLQRFKARLKGTNASMLKQLVRVVRQLKHALNTGAAASVVLPTALLAGVEHVNLRTLVRYLRDSRMARKIGGYVDSVDEKQHATHHMHNLEAFLIACASANSNGRVIVSPATTPAAPASPTAASPSLRYILLEPADTFRSVVDESRAVVLAGGTMAPIDDLRSQLFPYAQDRFSSFSCGHIVDKDRVLTRVAERGPSGLQLDFRFASQGKPEMLEELRKAVMQIAGKVKRGVVCFLPSHSMLNRVRALQFAHHRVFFESPQVEQTLRAYSDAAPSGAILFAVVGGRLSEGINFSDDLARCVLVVGIPFPNRSSVDLSERLKVASNAEALYENMAFRAVNQSIGRAIRHINDWSSIVLLDHRYARHKSKLPAWLASSFAAHQHWQPLLNDVEGFYNTRVATSQAS